MNFKQLLEGNIEFICSGAYVFGSPMHKRVERTIAIRIEKCCTLVPIIKQSKILITKDSYEALLVTGVAVFVIWITTILMRFDSELMDPLKLVCMMMSVAMSREHGKLVERIIFGACLIASLAYSSTIFAQLTDILLQTNTEIPFESFKDLDKSGLRLQMHPNLINRTFVDAERDHALLNIKMKTDEYLLTNQCPGQLLKDKNISCAGGESWAKMFIQTTRKHDEFTMKLAKPCFWSATMAFILQKGSPYVNSFNQVISHLTESGLTVKWTEDYIREVMFETKRKQGPFEGQKEKSELAEQLWNVIIFGSLASLIAFVGEIILFKIMKENNWIFEKIRVW